MKKTARFVISILFIAGVRQGFADAPSEVYYRGQLSGADAAFSGTKNVTFGVWDASTSGTQLFTETWTNVQLSTGVFALPIGGNTPGGLPPSVFQSGVTRWLDVAVSGEGPTPRIQLVSAPYALAVASGSVGTTEIRDRSVTASKLDLDLGTMGIGVPADPSVALHLKGTATNDPTNTSASHARIIIENALGNEWFLNTWDYINQFSIGRVGVSDDLIISPQGFVGIHTDTIPHLLTLSGGAYSDGATWVNASSIRLKTDVSPLSESAAMETLRGLSPVTFRYKQQLDEKHVGFIAEDVPDLVATKDRTGLSPMDIVAVLTKVVQKQQQEIEQLKKRLDNVQP